jgi:hypothetical protein
MSGSSKGMICGVVNVAMVAACIAVTEGKHEAPQLFVLIAMFGAIPGMICGGILGHVAETSANVRRPILLGTMILFSCTMVAILGSLFAIENLIVVSWIPTIVSSSILERWTRPAPSPIPVAKAS